MSVIRIDTNVSIDEKIPRYISASKILDYLYVGSKNYLPSDYTAVINLASELKTDEKDNYLYIPLKDNLDQELSTAVELVIKFINDHREKISSPKILCHCYSGISRSPSIVMGYLIRRLDMKFEDAYNLVKLSRPVVDPNISFISQLMKM